MTNEDRPSTNVPASAQLMQLIWPGAMASQAIYAAAKLGVADQVKNGVTKIEELAKVTGANPSALHRLLRALTSLNIFSEKATGIFENTELSTAD